MDTNKKRQRPKRKAPKVEEVREETVATLTGPPTDEAKAAGAEEVQTVEAALMDDTAEEMSQGPVVSEETQTDEVAVVHGAVGEVSQKPVLSEEAPTPQGTILQQLMSIPAFRQRVVTRLVKRLE